MFKANHKDTRIFYLLWLWRYICLLGSYLHLYWMMFIILITFTFFMICRKIRIWCTLYKIKKIINLWWYGCDTLRHFNLNIFVTITKKELYIMIETVSQLLLNTFSKNCSRPTSYILTSIIKMIRKKAEKRCKTKLQCSF